MVSSIALILLVVPLMVIGRVSPILTHLLCLSGGQTMDIDTNIVFVVLTLLEMVHGLMLSPQVGPFL